jgi:hypothetical protein
MGDYAYIIAGIGLGIAGLSAVYLYQRRRSQGASENTWLSYLLIWPLVLNADKDKREGQFLTKREWLGWGIVALVIVFAIVFVPSNRGGS